MLNDPASNPAEIAALKALEGVYACIDEGSSFLLEAGAGAGKTYSLICALRRMIDQHGADLIRRRQQIACITFTNVAKEEIESRTDRHPAIHAETVHGFCWSVLKDFQPHLRSLLSSSDKWIPLLEECGGLGSRRVEYELGYRNIEDGSVSIHHDDVLSLMAASLKVSKFRDVLTARYPIIFIDEYQDTDASFVKALQEQFLDTGTGPFIGFFGDHWQKIYGTAACGKVEHPKLKMIGKEANFRSVPAVVNCLNRMRPDLPQMVRDPSAIGEIRVFHTNEWVGVRQTSAHWKGDTPTDVSHAYLSLVRARLTGAGWDFDPEKTKILMLTHNVLAKEQGYPSIPNIFPSNDAFLKKEDPHISYFAETLETACAAFECKRYGEMFAAFGSRIPPIKTHAFKLRWSEMMDGLVALRKNGTVGEVVEYIKGGGLLRLPEKMEERERSLAQWKPEPDVEEPGRIKRLRELREVPYKEIIELVRFIDGHTPFSTKHGVKGAEFENVLVVLGRGWNQYNFEQMLEWGGGHGSVPAGKQETFERNRNLFYVACSRPKVRLALLFTQHLSDTAMRTLSDWFGTETLESLPSVVEL